MRADIAIIFGTRPSFIKLWPVWRGLVAEGYEPTVICTGQHEELVKQHMGVLDMPVHRWLDVMKDTTGLNSTMSLVLERVDAALAELQPRLVVVHGDTTSGFGAALAAYHRQIPVAHIEAGLRSSNPFSPLPEEVNRIGMDALATLLFAPTVLAGERAQQTNPQGRLEVVGNPVVDSVISVMSARHLYERFPYRPYILLELHRRESFGVSLQAMVEAVYAAAQTNGHHIVWPVHPNPEVRAISRHWLDAPNIHLVDPFGYAEFLWLVYDAGLVLTDSGGVVEEAPSLGTPTLQLRDYTDRQEAIPTFSWLVGRNPQDIEKLTGEALAISQTWKASIATKANPFGDGRSGARIAKSIKEWLATR